MSEIQSSKTVIVKDGTILEALKNSNFRVALDEKTESGAEIIVLATLSGKLRKRYLRLFAGDKVRMEFSPHDSTRGRIIQRN